MKSLVIATLLLLSINSCKRELIQQTEYATLLDSIKGVSIYHPIFTSYEMAAHAYTLRLCNSYTMKGYSIQSPTLCINDTIFRVNSKELIIDGWYLINRCVLLNAIYYIQNNKITEIKQAQ
jgi:TRAP-type mannitol/chloroaromatic compound transport system permease small subunit